MAMDKDILGDAWKDTVLACLGGTPAGADTAKIQTLMRAMADDLIQHFIANAEVNDIATSTPDAQAGTSTLPGTATGTITA